MQIPDHLHLRQTCAKCGGQVIPEDALWQDTEWFCEDCGALHDVTVLYECRLMETETGSEPSCKP